MSLLFPVAVINYDIITSSGRLKNDRRTGETPNDAFLKSIESKLHPHQKKRKKREKKKIHDNAHLIAQKHTVTHGYFWERQKHADAQWTATLAQQKRDTWRAAAA